MIRHDELRAFQLQHKYWLNRNFPNQDPVDGLLGMVEEIGELTHSFLKAKQNIRTNENHEGLIMDALGDIMIYMASFCNTNNIDMAECLEVAWEEVSARDWQAHRETGVDAKQPETTGASGEDTKGN